MSANDAPTEASRVLATSTPDSASLRISLPRQFQSSVRTAGSIPSFGSDAKYVVKTYGPAVTISGYRRKGFFAISSG